MTAALTNWWHDDVPPPMPAAAPAPRATSGHIRPVVGTRWMRPDPTPRPRPQARPRGLAIAEGMVALGMAGAVWLAALMLSLALIALVTVPLAGVVS